MSQTYAHVMILAPDLFGYRCVTACLTHKVQRKSLKPSRGQPELVKSSGFASAGENGVTNQTTDVVCSLTPEWRALVSVFLDRNLVRCHERCVRAPT